MRRDAAIDAADEDATARTLRDAPSREATCDDAVRATERLTAALIAQRSASPPAVRSFRNSYDDASDPHRRRLSADVPSSGDDAHGLLWSSARDLYAEKTVARRREEWTDRLPLLSAVQVEGEVTALGVLPQRGENDISRYFAAGDGHGRVYIFRPDGDLVVESESDTNSSVTALGAMLVRRNETMVVSGHANGDVVFHRIVESVHREDDAAMASDDVHTLTAEVVARHSTALASPAAAAGMEARHAHARGGLNAAARPTDRTNGMNDEDRATAVPAGDGNLVPTSVKGVDGALVTAVEMYRIRGKRFIAVADSAGTVAVYKESGSALHAVFRAAAPVVAFKQSTHSIAWITEDGVGVADPETLELRTVACMHINGTSMTHARFDHGVSSKFYAVSLEGDVLVGFVNVDTAKLGCVIRGRRAAGLAPESTLATIKGYAFVASGYDVGVMNTTGAGRAPPKEVIATPLRRLAASFGHHIGEDERGPPVVVTNRGRLVVVAFPQGLVAAYESDLPVLRPKPMDTNLWNQPVFVVMIALIAVWQFYRQKGAHVRYGSGAGGDFDPAAFAEMMKKEGGRGAGGSEEFVKGMGKYGERAMQRKGYQDFDPAKFREEMKRTGRWER